VRARVVIRARARGDSLADFGDSGTDGIIVITTSTLLLSGSSTGVAPGYGEGP
jgi:hypothetical protein